MNVIWILPLCVSALASLAIAGAIFLKRGSGPVERAAVLTLSTVSWIQASQALAFVDTSRLLLWKHATMVGEIVFPLALYQIGASFIQITSSTDRLTARWQFWILILAGTMCAGLLVLPLVPVELFGLIRDPWGQSLLNRARTLFILVALVIALAQFEQILRAARDPLRYQIKFVVIGFGGLAGLAILQVSQLEGVFRWNREYAFVSGLITLVSLTLIAYGLSRWTTRGLHRSVYISPQTLYTSLSFLIVGGYFVVVGAVGALVRQTGWPMSEALGLLVMFLAALTLVIVALSREARAQLRLWIARHFSQSKYDYRLKWLEVTEAFRTCDSVERILDRLLDVLIRTFGAGHVTIWLRYEADGRFHQVRSANIEAPPKPLDETHPLIDRLGCAKQDIVMLGQTEAHADEVWQAFLRATQAVLCVSLRTPDKLYGFVTLSEEFGHHQYSDDDFDLLRAICHYVTAELGQAILAEEQTAAAKWEAVSRFAAFYLHDLKTLVAGLSLVAQNAQAHGHDPAFQQAAMRTVTNTVNKMTELIHKLSLQTKSLTPAEPESVQLVDLNELINNAVQAVVQEGPSPILSLDSALPPVALVPAHFRQVLVNLLINARQSAGNEGEVTITTHAQDGTVVVVIADTGPGIPEPQLRTLFQPFKTTKHDGFGIGLYQCKVIVEQARGRIRIESEENRGTRVHIALPAAHTTHHAPLSVREPVGAISP
ncbi:MAG: PEP-CTERM system histidine kinase PrsK [Nitrospirae bacterium]|nr:MAG: PEP-CTERM system histidine kinase PrsK [Nitrospirota bacterium]